MITNAKINKAVVKDSVKQILKDLSAQLRANDLKVTESWKKDVIALAEVTTAVQILSEAAKNPKAVTADDFGDDVDPYQRGGLQTQIPTKTGAGRVKPTKGQVEAGRAVGGKVQDLIMRLGGGERSDMYDDPELRTMVQKNSQKLVTTIITKIVKPYLAPYLKKAGIKMKENQQRAFEQELVKIIMEGIDQTIITEGVFSRIGSKLGLGPKDTDSALSNLSYRYDKYRSAIGRLEYYADDPKRWNPEDVDEYLEAKIGVYEAYESANTAMFEAGANKKQKKRFAELRKLLNSHRELMDQIDMEMISYDEYAEKAAAAEREQERRIAAAKQRSADREAEEKARKKQQAKDRADSKAFAARKAERDSAAIKKYVDGLGGYKRDPCRDNCKEEHKSDIRRGYTDDYDKCLQTCREDAPDGSRRI